MPDEDQNIGTTPDNTPSPESSPAEIPTETSDPSTELVQQTPAEATPLQTVGDAWNAFAKTRQESKEGFQRPQNPNQPPVKQGRDYSGLDQNEVAWFKNMGGLAFDELKPRYLEFKKLKAEHETLKQNFEQNSKSSFFEHDQAYQLTPEYQSHTANLNQLNAEASHWQAQLEAIRSGQPWQPLIQDEKGNVIIGEPQEASPRGEAVIMNALTQAHILKTDISNKLQGIQSSFKSQHQGFMSKLQEVDKYIFQGADQTVLEKAMATKLPMFPAHMHGNPLVKSLAKSLAVIDGLIIMLNEKKSAATTQTIKARTQANGGPSSGAVQPASATHGQTVGNVWDEFKKARMGGLA